MYIKFFLSLTLHYGVEFGQILMQILMKKLGIRIWGPSLSPAVIIIIIISETIIIRIIIIFGTLQALVIRWSYVGVRGISAEFKSHSGNLANNKQDCPWLKSIFKKSLRRE